jgi:myosin heavy subunit
MDTTKEDLTQALHDKHTTLSTLAETKEELRASTERALMFAEDRHHAESLLDQEVSRRTIAEKAADSLQSEVVGLIETQACTKSELEQLRAQVAQLQADKEALQHKVGQLEATQTVTPAHHATAQDGEQRAAHHALATALRNGPAYTQLIDAVVRVQHAEEMHYPKYHEARCKHRGRFFYHPLSSCVLYRQSTAMFSRSASARTPSAPPTWATTRKGTSLLSPSTRSVL